MGRIFTDSSHALFREAAFKLLCLDAQTVQRSIVCAAMTIGGRGC